MDTHTEGIHADMTLSNIFELQNYPELIKTEIKLFSICAQTIVY